MTSKEQANKDFGGKKVSTEHQLVVVLLFRCVDYRLGADDLLDLLSNNVDVCLALIETLLKSSYEIELVIGVVRLLGEFCHPSTYFKSDESNEGKQNKEAKENSGSKSSTTLESNQDRSCIEFTQRVDKLIQHLMGASLLSSLAAAVQLRINKLARSKDPKEQDVVHVSTLVRHSVVFLLNSYTFLSVNPGKIGTTCCNMQCSSSTIFIRCIWIRTVSQQICNVFVTGITIRYSSMKFSINTF